LVYQNHAKPGAWEYTGFSQPPVIFRSIVEATNQSGLGINFDTANATAFANEPLDLLEKIIHSAICMHVADIKTKRVLHHASLGSGVMPFKAIFDLLKRYDWDGYV
jgi:sugar phosphate isomerase/epimerase